MDLKNYLKSRDIHLKDVAATLDCDISSVSRKLNGYTRWSSCDIEKLATKYSLSDAQIVDFFVRRAPALGERELV